MQTVRFGLIAKAGFYTIMNAEDFSARMTRPVIAIAKSSFAKANQRGMLEPDTLLLLESMLECEGSISLSVLNSNGITANEVRELCDKSTVSDIALPEVRTQCFTEANLLGHSYPGTEHLLLAICHFNGCRASQLIQSKTDGTIAISKDIIEILGVSWKRWCRLHRN